MVKKRTIPRKVKASDLTYKGEINNGNYDVYGRVYDELGLDKIVKGTANDGKINEVIKGLVVGRISHPNCSKAKLQKILSEKYDLHFPLHDCYLAMDELLKVKDRMMSIVFNESLRLHGGKIEHLLFDVTTTYFESVVCEGLRQKGFSKDGKHHQSQIVKSLLTTDRGFPVGYKLFPGNTGECTTLIEQIEEVRAKHPELRGASIAADRAMSNDKNFSINRKLSVDNCREIVASVTMAVMVTAEQDDGYLYLFPVQLKEEQQRVYDAVDVAYRRKSVRILSPPTGQLYNL